MAVSRKTLKVEVQWDHIKKVSSGGAFAGLCELIWNALDADAQNVRISSELELELGLGSETLVVSDDGTGFTHDDAQEFYVKLGGSWKKAGEKTRAGRFLHGQEGKGRFKAFNIGHAIDWKVVYEKGEEFREFCIEGRSDHIGEIVLTDPSSSNDRKPGVNVKVTGAGERFREFRSENFTDIVIKKLLPVFAPYLIQYRDVRIFVNRKKLDERKAIDHVETIGLDKIGNGGGKYSFEIEIVEWQSIKKKEIWFADKNGFPLEKYDEKIYGAAGENYTAFLKSDYFRKLHKEGRLSLHKMDSRISAHCREAIKEMREYFVKRALVGVGQRVEEWKEEGVYPYDSPTSSPVEDVEQKIFDVVAVNIEKNLPNFNKLPKKAKQLELRIWKQIVRNGSEDLYQIIEEWWALPREAREDFIELLKEVKFFGVIRACKTVFDRFKFIDELKRLVFDEKDTTKERGQLHDIIAEHAWIFGDVYTLSASDQDLTKVLEKHLKETGWGRTADEPVRTSEGKRARVDMMLSRSIVRNYHKEREHLIVELKRPSVVIDHRAVQQVERYAFTIAGDERFRGRTTKWNFLLVSLKCDEYVKRRLSDSRFGTDGILYKNQSDTDITIRVKTWDEIIQENQCKLEFFREALEAKVNKSGISERLTGFKRIVVDKNRGE